MPSSLTWKEVYAADKETLLLCIILFIINPSNKQIYYPFQHNIVLILLIMHWT